MHEDLSNVFRIVIINNYSYKNKYPNIITSFEKTRLETGGGIKKALKYFNSSNILAINGDSLLISDSNSCPVKKLCENFDKDKMDILLLLCPIKNCIGYSGKGDYSKGAIKNASIIKRKVANSEEAYVFTGWQIIKKKLIEKTKLKSFSLNIIFDRVEKNKKLYGIIFEGNFLHISTPKSILQIENYLSKYKISL